MAHDQTSTADNNDSIDVSRVYCTSAQIKRVGRSIAVSLDDATLPGNAKNKHMVVLYRGGARWSKEEVAAFDAAAAQWKRERNGHEEAPTTFTLADWGPRSAAIAGDLKALCLALRVRFAGKSSDAQRVVFALDLGGSGGGLGARRFFGFEFGMGPPLGRFRPFPGAR